MESLCDSTVSKYLWILWIASLVTLTRKDGKRELNDSIPQNLAWKRILLVIVDLIKTRLESTEL